MEDLSLQEGDLSRSHYSRLLGPPLIYCMGDILTPPGLYIVPATQINRNERDHQTVVPQTVFWSFECKSTNNTDLLEAKKRQFTDIDQNDEAAICQF